MPELSLLCARPHAQIVDFDASRFVVSTGRGIDVAIDNEVRHLTLGDEVPPGALNSIALRQLYEATHEIETLEYALTLDWLRDAVAQRAAQGAPAPDMTIPSRAEALAKVDELQSLSRQQLAVMCRKAGLNAEGTRRELRERLSSVLAPPL